MNVDNETLQRLMSNKAAMDALMSIEGFRSLNQDIETIINKSEGVNKARREANDEDLSAKQKKELTEAEKEYKSKRKEIQPGLFKKITALSIKDFELLVSLGVFNSALMNDAVYKFKRYEDASLSYTGINKHGDQEVGLYDTVLSPEDYQASLANVPRG